jgi:beta-phosphoglucomutase
MFKGIEAVIFDLDGVILESESYHNQAILNVLEQEGFPNDPGYLSDYVGKTTPIFLREFYAAQGKELSDQEHARLVQRKIEEFTAIFVPAPHEGALELITALAGKFKLAVASNSSSAYVRRNLLALGVMEAFGVAIGVDEVGRPKPEPDIFLKAAEMLGSPADRCLVIEDSIHGVAAAESGGMRCLAVTTNYPAEALKDADKVVGSLKEVKLA